MVQTEDGAMIEVTNMLQRMRELSVQAASGTMGSTDRTALDTEFSALATQIQAVGANTQWNGSDLLDGGSAVAAKNFQIGANASQTIDHTFIDLEVANASAHSHTGVNTTNSGSDPTVSTMVFGGATTDKGFLTGDTVTFTVDSVAFSGTVTASSGIITGLKMHGGTNDITGTSGSATDATTISTAAAGAITIKKTAGNTFTLTSTTASSGVAKFTAAYVTTANDGSTSFSNGSVARGVTAGALYADISTSAGANSALKTVDQMLTNVNSARASSGAIINRLEYAADNLANVSQNTSASRSRILDADYAAETTELARTQIIQQAGTAMLSQANQAAQSVLSLLK
tara:strand:+ start:1 stop:1032 length:1032 start_codon:yes stop_codon:yes gene_type:complete